jgi:hypothetical protein
MSPSPSRIAGVWRDEDEALLQRLEDEGLAEALFQSVVGEGAGGVHPRAGGLIAEVRKLAAGAEVVAAALAGSVSSLSQFVHGLVLRECSPELLHHLALFHGRAAVMLEQARPDASATAWVRALAAWLALGEERAYLERLEAAVVGAEKTKSAQPATLLVTDLAKRAEATARDLGPPGRAALLALARIDEAARLAGTTPSAASRANAEAQRLRNHAIETALSVIGEGLDEANVRGELASSGRTLLLRAIPVWTWTSNDEQVEHFVVDRIDKIGWELYRARNWSALRYLLDPFRPMFDRLAARIEADSANIAYAAGCAQMFVFLSQVDDQLARKIELAERALKVCPTHRNGRLVLAALLCDRAMETMRAMVLFARRADLERVEAQLERAESLYPRTEELPEAKAMLARVKRGRIAV